MMIQKRKVKISYMQKEIDYKTLSDRLACIYLKNSSGGNSANEKSNSIK